MPALIGSGPNQVSTNGTLGKLAFLDQTPLNYAISASSGLFSTSSTTEVAVTNLSVTITTTGRPVEIRLVEGWVVVSRASSGTAQGYVKLSGSSGYSYTYEPYSAVGGSTTNTQAIPGSSYLWLDTPLAGTHTYSVLVHGTSGTSILVNTAKLMAREI